VNTTVLCGNFGRAETDLGVLNLAQLRLGDILDLDPQQFTANRVVSFDPKGVQPPTPEVDSTSLLKKTDFNVSFSVDLPATVQADAKAFISTNTAFVLKNSSRTQIADPLGEINADPTLRAKMKEVKTGHIIMVISGLISAKQLTIKLDKATGTEGGADLFKLGKYEFAVNYDCKSSIEQLAQKGAPLFWKGSQAKYDAAADKLVFDYTPIDLNKFNFVVTVR
jgi:hypothetical protein